MEKLQFSSELNWRKYSITLLGEWRHSRLWSQPWGSPQTSTRRSSCEGQN